MCVVLSTSKIFEFFSMGKNSTICVSILATLDATEYFEWALVNCQELKRIKFI